MEIFSYYRANQMEAFTAVSVSWDFHIMHCMEFYLCTGVGYYQIFCHRNFSLFLHRWNVFFKANLAFFSKLLPVISCVKAHSSSYQVLYNCVFDSAVFSPLSGSSRVGGGGNCSSDSCRGKLSLSISLLCLPVYVCLSQSAWELLLNLNSRNKF